MINSLLDILKEEDELIKELDEVRYKIISLLHTVDDDKIYPKHYQHVNVEQCEKEIEDLKCREKILNVEISQRRKSILRYLLSEIQV